MYVVFGKTEMIGFKTCSTWKQSADKIVVSKSHVPNSEDLFCSSRYWLKYNNCSNTTCPQACYCIKRWPISVRLGERNNFIHCIVTFLTDLIPFIIYIFPTSDIKNEFLMKLIKFKKNYIKCHCLRKIYLF